MSHHTANDTLEVQSDEAEDTSVILLSCTYSVITDESAEHGESEESGFKWENVEHTIDEVVKLIRGAQPSCSDALQGWFIHVGERDYVDGTITEESIHFCRGQSEEAFAAWKKAIQLAGFRVAA